MKAARLHGFHHLSVDDVAPPPDPGPDEVLVAPLWCGLCGTDVREYLGPGGAVPSPDEPHPLTGAHKPLILGHEFSARVVAVGTGVSHVSEGDRLAVFPLIGCGRCPACRRGDTQYCPDRAWNGLSTAYGGLGDLALIRSEQAVPARGMSDVDAALVEPAAVALRAVLSSGAGPGDPVLVTGFGPIGAMAALALTAIGAGPVLVYEPREALWGRVTALGFTPLPAGPVEDRLARIREIAPEGVAVAVDCAGKADSVELCLRAVRDGGTVAVPAIHTEPRPVDLWKLTRGSLRIVGSQGYTRTVWERTIALIEAGRLPVAGVVTHTVDRAEVEDVLARRPQPDDDRLKVLVRVGG